MKRPLFFIFVLAISLMGLVSTVQAETAFTDVCGDLTTDTWTLANSPYRVTCDITIMSSATLTIQPGVEVQFRNNSYDLFVRGSLVADGTAAQPINFTRSTDTTYWGGIQIQPGADAVLDYVTLEYGGRGSFSLNRSLSIESSDVQVTNSIVREGYGTEAPIYIANVAADPIFSNLTLEGNGADRIDLAGGTLAGDRTLGHVGPQPVPYRWLDDVTVATNQTLTVTAGVEVQFRDSSHDLFVRGSLVADGTAAQPIKFTRSVDTTYWGGIQILSGADAVLDYVTIEYGGRGSFSLDRSLSIESSDVQVTNSIVREGYGTEAPIYIANVAPDPIFSNLTLEGNGADRIDLAGGTLAGDRTLGHVGPQLVPYRWLDDVTVPPNKTLTVAPGIEIQFQYSGHDLLVNGSLVADGTATQPIKFTRGVHTHWGGIHIRAGAAAVLDYVTLEYGAGVSSIGRSLWIESSDVQVTNSLVREGYGTGAPIYIANVAPDPILSNLTLQGNGADHIELAGGTLVGDRTLGHVGPQPVPYRWLDDVTVPPNKTLTVAPGIEIQFQYSGHDLLVNGSLVADGTAMQPIKFTRGVHTHWGGIHIRAGAAAVLDYVTLEYGGGVSSIGRSLRIESSNVQVSNSLVRESYGSNAAIYLSNGAAPTILNSQITANSSGLYVHSGQPVMSGNSITGNSDYGVNNVSGTSIDARGNYWGDPSGPYHPTLNPGGLGDDVSDDVLFDPWMASAPVESVADVVITGPTNGEVESEHSFTAIVNPFTATMPITYTWQATDHAQVIDTDGTTSMVTFAWTTTGTKVITVMATNAGGSASTTHTITITEVAEVSRIYDVRTTNVRDSSFTVSWLTDVAGSGEVHYGTDPNNLNQIAYDERGAATEDDTHYVIVDEVQPETTYYFDVLSGGVTDDNNGTHYQITTGPIVSLPSPETIYGDVLLSDGSTPASGSIIYISLTDADGSGSTGQAAPLSALVDSNGDWFTNLGNARTADLSGLFLYSASGDSLRLEAVGAGDGSGCEIVDTANDTPASDIVLDVSHCTTTWPMNLQTGWNHISLPLDPLTPLMASDVCNDINTQGGNISEIDRWHNGGWDGHICSEPFNNFEIVLGSDYFIKSHTPHTWVLEGHQVTEAVPLTLQMGWNSIGIPHTDAYTAESLCNDIISQGVTVVEIDRWHTAGWDGHICGLPFNNFAIERGFGYFIKSTSWGTVIPSAPPESLLQPARAMQAQPEEIPAGKTLPVRDLRLSNLRDTSVTLSWSTDEATTGYVRFGETAGKLEQVTYDSRGATSSSTTHVVVLNNLTPETTYHFEIISGSEVDQTTQSSLTTAPSLDSLPQSDTIYGQVFEADGSTPAAGALVYLMLQDADREGSEGEATLLSAVTDSEGYWHANLGNARQTESGNAFSYSATGDKLLLTVQRGTKSSTTITLDTSQLRPAAPIILKDQAAWDLYLPLIGN